MRSDSDFAEKIHLEIHAVRRIQGYKPNPMEVNVSKLVIEHFPECEECKEAGLKQKYAPQNQQGKGFFDKLGEVFKK